jgi:hypothetical protein
MSKRPHAYLLKEITALGCDFFERRGEKHRRWNTFDVPIFFFSDGLLCFWSILCVILLEFPTESVFFGQYRSVFFGKCKYHTGGKLGQYVVSTYVR